jgi:hypothetical protein
MKKLVILITSLFCLTVITYSQGDSMTVKVPIGSVSSLAGLGVDSMRTNVWNALNGKQASGSYATTATTDSMRTRINNDLNGKQAAGSYLVAADIAGKANLSGASFTGSIGYGSGVGGTVTQATSKTTGVTLNKLCGAITTNNAALAAAAEAKFTVTNSTVAATDVVVVSIKSGGTSGSYVISVSAVGAGSFDITISNVSAGSLSEALVINYSVIKAVAN